MKENRNLHLKLTFEIVKKLEWWHISQNCHIPPRRAKWDNLFSPTSRLPVLFCSNKTP